MDTTRIVEQLNLEIARLERARALLQGHTAPLKRGPKPAKRSGMSADGRARIAAAQKARWARAKKK
jgi:hypothetical protein